MPKKVGRTLGDLVRQRQRSLFVGRSRERALLLDALLGAAPRVVYIHGPGGIGKTALTAEIERACADRDVPFFRIDGRDTEPQPSAMLAALGEVTGTADDPLARLGHGRYVLCVDTFETLATIDRWVRETLLPQLSAEALVVFATRDPPSPAWREHPGWGSLFVAMPLDSLDDNDALAYLHARGVPVAHRAKVVTFARGHPLALSLVADVCAHHAGEPFWPEITPDVVGALVSRFVHEVHTEEQRRALEACAVVRACSEPLLASLLDLPPGTPAIARLFSWLRGLSFIESGRYGIFPHDLARDVLVADLKWRDPDAFRGFVERAHAYNAARMKTDARFVTDDVFLHRSNPVVAPFLAWSETPGHRVEAATASDLPALLALVEQHEGPGSRRLAEHWLSRQLDNVMVVRGKTQTPEGFVALVSLDRATPDEIAVDPGARAAWAYVSRQGGLEPAQAAVIFRFWMARDSYQSASPTQSACMLVILHHEITTPHLAFSFWPCADPEYFAEVTKFSSSPRVPEADFEAGGRRFGVYMHDWRTTTPVAWLAQLAKRASGAGESTQPRTSRAATLIRSAFDAAAREALKNLGNVRALRDNALVRSALVSQKASAGADPVSVLVTLLRDAASALQGTPRGKKAYRAIDATFLDPADSQERAAEKLDLPFSTYRRHLGEGINEIVGALWQQELLARRE